MTGKVYGDISVSLDGYVAGRNDSPDNPMGDGGEQVHDWVTRLHAWRERHGMEGGDVNSDDALMADFFPAVGAVVMGRRMFDHGYAPWGDPPPLHTPVFVLTHRPQASIVKLGGTTYHFVEGGIENAVRLAQAAADDQDVSVIGGASILQQAMRARLIERFSVHVTPVLLGGGVRLFENLDTDQPMMAVDRIIASPHVAHYILTRAA